MPDTPDPTRRIHGFLEEVWNAHDLDRFGDYVSRDVVFHPPRGQPFAYDKYRRMAGEFMDAFSDLHFTAEDVYAEGDRVCTRLIIEGTNDGPYRGRDATGKRVRVRGQPQFRLEGDQVVEVWQLFDELGMLHQLGHIPDETLLGAGHSSVVPE